MIGLRFPTVSLTWWLENNRASCMQRQRMQLLPSINKMLLYQMRVLLFQQSIGYMRRLEARVRVVVGFFSFLWIEKTTILKKGTKKVNRREIQQFMQVTSHTFQLPDIRQTWTVMTETTKWWNWFCVLTVIYQIMELSYSVHPAILYKTPVGKSKSKLSLRFL